MSDAINQRAQHVLKVLVERYIQEGSPVGSKIIAEESALGLSSATIRNILADLEETGYLVSPHTSAGRVPTEMGYRFFVNSLLTVKSFDQGAADTLKDKFNPDSSLPHLLQSASSLLSGLTQMIGVVSLPKRNRFELRQVEFLPLNNNRVLVILVLNNREVQNRIIQTERPYQAPELQEAANYLNTHFVGKDLEQARQELYKAMHQEREQMASLMKTALEMANKSFMTEPESADYVMAGQNNLFAYPHDIAQLNEIFQAFAQKQDVLFLLDHALQAEGIQIFIGKESGCEAFDACSIITRSYSSDGQLVGSLGVIGPRRMPYDRVISAVDITAKLLSSALNHG